VVEQVGGSIYESTGRRKDLQRISLSVTQSESATRFVAPTGDFKPHGDQEKNKNAYIFVFVLTEWSSYHLLYVANGRKRFSEKKKKKKKKIEPKNATFLVLCAGKHFLVLAVTCEQIGLRCGLSQAGRRQSVISGGWSGFKYTHTLARLSTYSFK
jgi:hypothetical protein